MGAIYFSDRIINCHVHCNSFPVLFRVRADWFHSGICLLKIEFPVLLGDIGGTNARFAFIHDSSSEAVFFEPVRVGAYDTLELALEDGVLPALDTAPATMLLAVATPLVGDVFRLTNANWTISPSSVIEQFGLRELILMNDFAAQALAAFALQGDELAPLGDGRQLDGYPKVIIGPGTGLGISSAIHVEGKWAILAGEGGHIDLGPRTEREYAVWAHLEKANGRISAELAVSGRGLENLYQAICRIDGVAYRGETAAQISRAAINDTTPQAREAVDLFITLLARISGDMALLTLAMGGVYLAGGIVAKMLPAIRAERFRAEFEDKAPHQAILRSVPVNIMMHPAAALLGLAVCVRRAEMFSVEHSALRFRSGKIM
jgi:glucokinase